VVAGLNKTVTDKEIQELCLAHVVSFIELEPGVIYAPPGMGQTTARIGVEVVRASHHYARLMREYEKIIKENIYELKEKVIEEGVVLGKKPSFSLKIEDCKYGFI
jgi:hypothetical protein